MKKHSKVGNRSGKPAYRTPSDFKIRECKTIDSLQKNKKKNKEKYV